MGARPLVISDTLAVEMEPAGRKILKPLGGNWRLTVLKTLFLQAAVKKIFPPQ